MISSCLSCYVCCCCCYVTNSLPASVPHIINCSFTPFWPFLVWSGGKSLQVFLMLPNPPPGDFTDKQDPTFLSKQRARLCDGFRTPLWSLFFGGRTQRTADKPASKQLFLYLFESARSCRNESNVWTKCNKSQVKNPGGIRRGELQDEECLACRISMFSHRADKRLFALQASAVWETQMGFFQMWVQRL